MRKNGFTLLELLVVIVIIGILATLIASGATFAVRSARQKRCELSCSVLRTAIARYHTEYNEWPGGDPPTGDPDHDGDVEKTFKGAENKDVFGMLRLGSPDNRKGVQFFDETAFFTEAPGGGEARKLSETDPAVRQPLVFLSRSGKVLNSRGEYHYYQVYINYSKDLVKVTAPGFKDEDEED